MISISFASQNPIWIFKILLIGSQECEFDLLCLCKSMSFWQIVDQWIWFELLWTEFWFFVSGVWFCRRGGGLNSLGNKMGVMSRRVVPACGSLCFFCPSLRARSRQPVKRYKKLIADILPRNQVIWYVIHGSLLLSFLLFLWVFYGLEGYWIELELSSCALNVVVVLI